MGLRRGSLDRAYIPCPLGKCECRLGGIRRFRQMRARRLQLTSESGLFCLRTLIPLMRQLRPSSLFQGFRVGLYNISVLAIPLYEELTRCVGRGPLFQVPSAHGLLFVCAYPHSFPRVQVPVWKAKQADLLVGFPFSSAGFCAAWRNALGAFSTFRFIALLAIPLGGSGPGKALSAVPMRPRLSAS